MTSSNLPEYDGHIDRQRSVERQQDQSSELNAHEEVVSSNPPFVHLAANARGSGATRAASMRRAQRIRGNRAVQRAISQARDDEQKPRRAADPNFAGDEIGKLPSHGPVVQRELMDSVLGEDDMMGNLLGEVGQNMWTQNSFVPDPSAYPDDPFPVHGKYPFAGGGGYGVAGYVK